MQQSAIYMWASAVKARFSRDVSTMGPNAWASVGVVFSHVARLEAGRRNHADVNKDFLVTASIKLTAVTTLDRASLSKSPLLLHLERIFFFAFPSSRSQIFELRHIFVRTFFFYLIFFTSLYLMQCFKLLSTLLIRS